MPSYIILNKFNQSVYTGSILNVFDKPELFYIICISKIRHTKSSLAKLRLG